MAAVDPGGPDPPPHHCPPGVVKWSLTNLFGLVHMALFFFFFVSGTLNYTLNRHDFITQRNMALFFIVHYLPK